MTPTTSSTEFSKVVGISITQNGKRWRVVINGDVYEGTGNPSLNVRNGVLYVDNVPHPEVIPLEKGDTLRLEIQVLGDLKALSTSGDVTVHGDVHGKVDAGGRVTVNGNVAGSVDAQERVEVGGNVGKKVDAMGRVEVHGSVSGKIDTMGKVIVHNRK